MAAVNPADALKRAPGPSWGIGERPTTAQAHITLPTYVFGEDDIVRHRSEDGKFVTQGEVSRPGTARVRRAHQRREGNGFKSNTHRSTLDYRTVDDLGVTPDALILDRKPPHTFETLKVVAPKHEVHIAEGRSVPAILLQAGKEVTSYVPQFAFKYYKIVVPHKNIALQLTVDSISGDPDIFVCNRHANPNQRHHTWKSAGMGSDEVMIASDDPWAFPGPYFIGVYGAYDTEYTILATFVRQRMLVRHPTSLEADDGASLMRDGIRAADTRRQLCMYGAGFLEQLALPRSLTGAQPKPSTPRFGSSTARPGPATGGEPARPATADSAAAPAPVGAYPQPPATARPTRFRQGPRAAGMEQPAPADEQEDAAEAPSEEAQPAELQQRATRPPRFCSVPASPRGGAPPASPRAGGASTPRAFAEPGSPREPAMAPSSECRTAAHLAAAQLAAAHRPASSATPRLRPASSGGGPSALAPILTLEDLPPESPPGRLATVRAHTALPATRRADPTDRAAAAAHAATAQGSLRTPRVRETRLVPARHHGGSANLAREREGPADGSTLDNATLANWGSAVRFFPVPPDAEGPGAEGEADVEARDAEASGDEAASTAAASTAAASSATTDAAAAGSEAKRWRTGSGALLLSEEQRRGIMQEIMKAVSPRDRWSYDVRTPRPASARDNLERLANLIRPQAVPVKVREPGEFEQELRNKTLLPSRLREERLATERAAKAAAAAVAAEHARRTSLAQQGVKGAWGARLTRRPTRVSIGSSNGGSTVGLVAASPGGAPSEMGSGMFTGHDIVTDMLAKAHRRSDKPASRVSSAGSNKGDAAAAAAAVSAAAAAKAALLGANRTPKKESLHRKAQRDIAVKYGMSPAEFALRTGIPLNEHVELERGEFSRLRQMLKGALEESLDLQADVRAAIYRFRSKAVQGIDTTARENFGWRQAVGPLIDAETHNILYSFEYEVEHQQATLQAHKDEGEDQERKRAPGAQVAVAAPSRQSTGLERAGTNRRMSAAGRAGPNSPRRGRRGSRLAHPPNRPSLVSIGGAASAAGPAHPQ